MGASLSTGRSIRKSTAIHIDLECDAGHGGADVALGSIRLCIPLKGRW